MTVKALPECACALVMTLLLAAACTTATESASPAPSPPAPTSRLATLAPPPTVAAATPTGSVLDDRFGFVWAEDPPRVLVRPETGQGGFQLFAQPYGFSWCGCAVSPDGTRIVYWTGETPIELRVLEVARPTQSATIYTAPDGHLVSAAAWSSDGSGILFSLEGVDASGLPDAGPPSSALLVIEASGGSPRTLIEYRRGAPVLVPLGWDRRAGVAAAGESGPGGYMFGYLTVRTSGDPTPQRTAIRENFLMISVDVSTDQRFVLGVVRDQTGSTLRWWKLTDFGAMMSGPRVGNEVRPKWRPHTAEIGWIQGAALQLLDVDRGVQIAGGTLPPGDYSLSAFRRDGSAVLARSGGVQTTHVLLELTSGRTTSLSSTGYVVGSLRFP